jgi:RNA polymerase sigma-70 factor (ECF subfamily)
MNKQFANVVDHLADLRRYALALTRVPYDAEDLVQDTLARAYERRRSFRAGSPIKPWLMSIMHNCFVDAQRKKAVRRDEGQEVEGSHVYPASQVDAVHLGEVRRAFMQLPDEQREALHLVAIEGLTYPEAALVLEVPEGTVLSRVSRARQTLRSGPKATLPKRFRIVGSSSHE